MTTLYIILAAVAVMTVSLVGIITVAGTIGRSIEKRLPYLVSFSAGVFLFTSFFMAREALHLLPHVASVLAFVVGGYLLAVLANRVIPDFHHHHDAECGGHTRGGRRLLVGDAVHNTIDGMILVPAFMVSPWLGLGTALSIVIHESIQELAEFFVLRSSGYSVHQALMLNFLTSSTILLGVGIGFLLSSSVVLQGVLLALSAGFFVQIVLSDLLPHHHHVLTPRSMAIHIALIAVGITTIGLVNATTAHSHAEEDAHEGEHELHDEEEEHGTSTVSTHE